MNYIKSCVLFIFMLSCFLTSNISFAAIERDSHQTSHSEEIEINYRKSLKYFFEAENNSEMVEIRLLLRWTGAPCSPADYCNVNLYLRNNRDDNLAHVVIDASFMNSSWRWYSFDIPNIEVEEGREYSIYLTNDFYDSSDSGLKWARTTSDRYPEGRYEYWIDGPNIRSDNDMAFETYVNIPDCTTDPGWKCYSDSQRAYQNRYCEWRDITRCSSDQRCLSGECITPESEMDLERIFIQKEETTTTEFNLGDNITIKAESQNHGADGEYTTHYDIYRSGTEIISNSITHDIPSGATVQLPWTIDIPFSWEEGTYEYRARINHCTGTCSRNMFFTIGPAPCSEHIECSGAELIRIHPDCSTETIETCTHGCLDEACITCIDNDEDGFFTNCGTERDCNDLNIDINPDADEICGNDIDENCDEIAEECPVLCDPAECGPNAGCIENSCTCSEGYGNADGFWDNGCEIDLLTDESNCGAIANVCAPAETCEAGLCISPEVPEGDYLVISLPLFQEIAENLLSEGNVTDYLFTDLSEDEAQTYLRNLLTHIENSLPTEEQYEDIATEEGITIEEARQGLNNINDHFAILEWGLDIVELISRPDIVYASQDIPISGGIPVAQATLVMRESDHIGGSLFKIQRYIQQYQNTIGRGTGLLSLIGIGFDLSTGLEEHDGSWLGAFVYAGSKQLEVGLILTDIFDTGSNTLLEFLIGPTFTPIDTNDWYNNLIENLYADGTHGAEMIDVCWEEGILVKCTERRIDLLAIILDPFPWIESFELIERETSPLVAANYAIKNSNIVFGDFIVKFVVTTDERVYTQEERIFINSFETNSYTILQEIAADESILEATLATYTECSGETHDTCQYWVDQKTIELLAPVHPTVDISPNELTIYEGELIEFNVEGTINGSDWHSSDWIEPSLTNVLNYENYDCASDICRRYFVATEIGEAGEYLAYYRLFNNFDLSTEDYTRITVLEKDGLTIPIIEIQPDDIEVIEGDTIRFNVNFFNINKNAEFSARIEPEHEMVDYLSHDLSDSCDADMCRQYSIETQDGDKGEYNLFISVIDDTGILSEDMLNIIILEDDPEISISTPSEGNDNESQDKPEGNAAEEVNLTPSCSLIIRKEN